MAMPACVWFGAMRKCTIFSLFPLYITDLLCISDLTSVYLLSWLSKPKDLLLVSLSLGIIPSTLFFYNCYSDRTLLP